MNTPTKASCLAAAFAASLFVFAPLSNAQSTSDAPSATKTDSSAKAASKLSRRDRGFLEKLAQANRAEIAAGEVAKTKATDEQLKNFAQQMIDDHSKALDEVSSLAASKNVELPTLPDSKHQKALARMQSLSAVEFNKEYLNKAAIDDHREALKLVKKVGKDAQDEDLKALAQKLEPTIAAHLKMALDMNKN